MGADGHRRTRFRTVCPSCGRVGTAEWRARAFEVRCPGCGGAYDYRGHTYRPVTGGMTDEERRRHRRDVQNALRARNRGRYRAKARERYAKWAVSATPEDREREAARVREWVRADPARVEANRERAGRWQRENRERYNARHRAWRREHRHEIKVREVMRKLNREPEAKPGRIVNLRP